MPIILRYIIAGLTGLVAVPFVQLCMSAIGAGGTLSEPRLGDPIDLLLASQLGAGLGNPWTLFITFGFVIVPVYRALEPTKKAPPAN
ncbi:hypothetical protein DBR00_02410 [Pseudomonas sp. HMWF032]|nr:hypothetical protein DBR00_02410 [Pseudomonas sp. HMWF032]PTT81384.1 hypothetical protein DBR41_17120 [Pseudomonas sp. HMWF010]